MIITNKETRILIWGKTYPELSKKYMETVCTGGVLEDGRPIRLYPVPFRYLEGAKQFKSYQWIRAKIARDPRDRRPESHKIDGNTIICEDAIPPDKFGWQARAEFMFKDNSWQFDSVENLLLKERADHTSLGVVEPCEILDVKIFNRADEEIQTFQEKLDWWKTECEIRQNQNVLFDDEFPLEMKALNYTPERLKVVWRCFGENCKTHEMQVLDWGLIELQRKVGMEKARDYLLDICNLSKHAIKFFLGNIHNHPTAFTIVGLWYPRISAQQGLF